MMKSTLRHLLSAAVVTACLQTACPLKASTSIDVGTHELLPDASGQSVTLSVTGDDQVRGFNLRAQIGDGSGPQIEPVFESIEFDGGIWDAFDKTSLGGPVADFEQFAQSSIALNHVGDAVVADGILVTLTVSTVGILAGVYDLRLTDTEIGESSDFILPGGATIVPAIQNGSFSIVPEPSSAGLAMVLLFVLASRRNCSRGS